MTRMLYISFPTGSGPWLLVAPFIYIKQVPVGDSKCVSCDLRLWLLVLL